GKEAAHLAGQRGALEIAKGRGPAREPVQDEASPGGYRREPTHVELVAVASQLLGVRLFLGGTHEGRHGDLVALREVTDDVERTNFPPALGRVGHPVAEKEDLHASRKGAPSVP